MAASTKQANKLGDSMHTVGKGKKTTFKNLKAFTDTLLLGDLSESLDEVTDSWLRFFRPPKDLEIL